MPAPAVHVIVNIKAFASREEHDVSSLPFTIGRGPLNDIQIPVRGLSRVHALIFWSGAGLQLLDMQTANGTWVSGQRALREPLAIATGADIRLGEAAIVNIIYDAVEFAAARPRNDPSNVRERGPREAFEKLLVRLTGARGATL